MKPKTDEQNIEFRKNVMEKNDDKIDEALATIQKTIENAASKVAHNTEAERENILQSTPGTVRSPCRPK